MPEIADRDLHREPVTGGLTVERFSIASVNCIDNGQKHRMSYIYQVENPHISRALRYRVPTDAPWLPRVRIERKTYDANMDQSTDVITLDKTYPN